MPVERYNLQGQVLRQDNAELTPQRANGQDLQLGENAPQLDRQHANNAQVYKDQGKITEARAEANLILDPVTRVTTFRELFGKADALAPPGGIYTEGYTGINDPLSLFFMMVFYLDKPVSQFSWSDVLKAARAATSGSQGFGMLTVDDSFLPQRIEVPGPAQVSQGRQETAEEGASRQVAANREQAAKDVQKARDANPNPLPTKTDGQPTVQGTSTVALWPIQNLPIVAGGLSKSVNWSGATMDSVITFAEPQIPMQGSGDPIELELEFTYAVGVPGVGDGESTAASATNSTVSSDPSAADSDGVSIWSVEDVMGMMYLATSLVYPWVSSSVFPDGKNKPRESAQYPVVFLKHLSLFPFLTPFVVKAVKIVPDEDQPLIVTEPQRLNGFDNHLSFPAVRQVVKITLSLQSAHYLLSTIKRDDGGQIQIQTSGKTYLQAAGALLGGRL